jgi:hypothetical protein
MHILGLGFQIIALKFTLAPSEIYPQTFSMGELMNLQILV